MRKFFSRNKDFKLNWTLKPTYIYTQYTYIHEMLWIYSLPKHREEAMMTQTYESIHSNQFRPNQWSGIALILERKFYTGVEPSERLGGEDPQLRTPQPHSNIKMVPRGFKGASIMPRERRKLFVRCSFLQPGSPDRLREILRQKQHTITN